jgi:dTDP-4-dehydrorhamnose reductase
MPIRLLVTGGTGLLGGAVLDAARARPEFVPVGTFPRAAPALPHVEWAPLDLRDPPGVARAFARARPDVVLHAAVAVEPDALAPVIVRGSEEVARAAQAYDAALIHMSSDMVFDGASGPFAEDASPSPVTDYGRAKADAEASVRALVPAATIVRCSLLWRLAPPDRSLAHWLETNYPLFTDELRCPAAVGDVAGALLELALRRGRGEAVPDVLHAVGPVALSRYDFGRLLLAALGRDPARAVAARSADSGVVRPRELVLTTHGTPSWFTAGLRGPAEALGLS